MYSQEKKRQENERKVEENKLDANIHFHGLLDEDEIKKLLTKLDVYIHASFAETMCTSVMQAMSCGLPIIGSDIPGINDIVEKDVNALLFSNKEPEILLKQPPTNAFWPVA